MRRRVLLTAATALAVAIALPASAGAHGLVGRADLPIPEWLFVWGAAVVLVVSFVGLAVLWPQPKLERAPGRALLAVPRAVDVACGAIGIALFVLVVYAGLAGTQVPTANLAPTAVYILMWVALVPLSAVFGDVFRAFNPWRAAARGVAWAAGRLTPGGLPEPLPYPERLGHWPAAAALLAFGWVELVKTGGDDPSLLALLALAYAAVQLFGMSLYGIEPWSDRGDGLGVYFGLFARLAPLARRGRELIVRPPLSGVTELRPIAGTIALLCVMLGTTTFDGASEGPVWTSIAPDVQRWLADHAGMSLGTALEVTFTFGLIACVLLIGGVYRLGVLGMRTVGGGHSAPELARRFVHTLVPIALAYVVAHYFSLLAYNGQATASLISDPLGEGSDLFGTAAATIDYGVISATGIWYVQVGALVAGHVAGLVLAHDRALVVYERAREAARSQRWMLAVMIGFTSLGLWLLSAANG